MSAPRSVLWWGRFDADYSRNRVLRQCFRELGWQIADFHPLLSPLGDWQARLALRTRPDLVWVPCFRQRDVAAARRWAKAHSVPLIFDPLISAYDKQVFERGKLDASSRGAVRLLAWERALLQGADRVLADTAMHADLFHSALGVPREKLAVVHIGADETLFKPAPHAPNTPLDVLFIGSFIALQGPEFIIEAARHYRGPAARWHLLGQGPLLAQCRQLAQQHPDIHFEEWLPFSQLPQRIQRADILLGIFGTSDKASRVIPNKVYQALACGKPLITRQSNAYPAALVNDPNSGICWVPPGNATALAEAIAEIAAHPQALGELGECSHASYQRFFSRTAIRAELAAVLQQIPGGP